MISQFIAHKQFSDHKEKDDTEFNEFIVQRMQRLTVWGGGGI